MTTFGGKIPIFDGANYGIWRVQIEALLHKNRLLKFVQGEIDVPAEPVEYEKWEERDKDARADLLMALAPSIINLVKNYKTSKEIWDFLKETYERKSPRQKVEVFRAIINIKMCEGQSISNYINEFDMLKARLEELGGSMDDELSAVVLIDGLSSEFKEVRATFNMMNDIPSINTLRSRLLELKTDEINVSEEAMKVKFYSRRQGYGEEAYQIKRKCYRCGKIGHIAKNCRVKLPASESYMVNSGFVAQDQIANNYGTPNIWYIDSGATSHMTFNENFFKELNKNHNGIVRLADNKELAVKGIGMVIFYGKVGNQIKEIHLNNVKWVPDLKTNLISTSKATDAGCRVEMTSNFAKISKNGLVLVEGEKIDGLYVVKVMSDKSCPVQESTGDMIELWHKRFGHLNVASLRNLKMKNMVVGIPNLGSGNIKCETCIRGKQTRDPFAVKTTKSSSQILELIHSDMCGPMKVESIGMKLYFVTFIDDFSRKISVKFLRKKSEYLTVFKEFKTASELETGYKIKIIRTDNAKELVSTDFESFLKDQGIKHQLTVPYTPEQNGVAERMNRTLVEMARCLMIEGNLPEMLWAELIHTSAYIRNICPTNMNNDKTPIHIWSGRIPNVFHLRKIGCDAYVLNKNPSKNKWEPRSNKYTLIGYDDQSKAYRLWMRGTRIVVKSRDVKFIESSVQFLDENVPEKNSKYIEFRMDFKINEPQTQSQDVSDPEVQSQHVSEDEFEDTSETIPDQSSWHQEDVINTNTSNFNTKSGNSQSANTDDQHSFDSIKRRLRSWTGIQDASHLSKENR